MPDMKTWTANGVQFTLPFAPAGYGLGEGSWRAGGNTQYSDAAALDNLKVNGFWAYQKSGSPLESNYTQTQFVYGITLASGAGFVTQRAVTCYTGVWIERNLITQNGEAAWTPWAYINPPMYAGVEYRTTDKVRGGAVVYRKRITYTNAAAFGSNGTLTEITIPHEIQNFGALVEVSGVVGTQQPLPYIDNGGRITAVSHVNATNVVLRTMTGWAANASWSFDIAYTKSS